MSGVLIEQKIAAVDLRHGDRFGIQIGALWKGQFAQPVAAQLPQLGYSLLAAQCYGDH